MVNTDIPSGFGQIKVDLSVDTYEIDEGRVNGKQKIRKLKYPSLAKIISTIEKTGAKICRVSAKGKYTYIDYSNLP